MGDDAAELVGVVVFLEGEAKDVDLAIPLNKVCHWPTEVQRPIERGVHERGVIFTA